VQIIKNTPGVRAVVVSALGGITDRLVHMMGLPVSERLLPLKSIIDTHLDLITALNLPIQSVLNLIWERLIDLSLIESLDAENKAALLACGEDLSSQIIAAYLNQEGIPIIHYDARQFLKTDDQFECAIPYWKDINTHLYPSTVFITQGFIGQSLKEKTTTLGRGGSDYTAALLAVALKVDCLCIYTDVPGVYTEDPKKNCAAEWIPFLSFEGMESMAYKGAKVLYPLAVKPCQEAGIPIHILSTFEPLKPGTMIAAA
jgi:aspartate kinase